MLSLFIRHWAKKQGLYIYGGRAHGVIKDYTVTVFESTGGLYFCIAAAFSNETRRLEFENKLAENAEEYDIENFSVTDKMTVVLLPSGMHAASFAENYKYFVFHELKKAGALGVKHCNCCLKPLEDEQAKLIFINNVALQVHRKCVYDFNIPQPEFQRDEPEPSLASGIKGAVIASLIYILICSILGCFLSVYGFMAVFLPFFIRYGYETMLGPTGKPKFMTIAIGTLSTIIVSQFIADWIYLYYLCFFEPAWANVSLSAVPMILIDNYIINESFLFTSLVNIGIAILMSFIEIIRSFKEMSQEQKVLQAQYNERQF